MDGGDGGVRGKGGPHPAPVNPGIPGREETLAFIKLAVLRIRPPPILLYYKNKILKLEMLSVCRFNWKIFIFISRSMFPEFNY